MSLSRFRNLLYYPSFFFRVGSIINLSFSFWFLAAIHRVSFEFLVCLFLTFFERNLPAIAGRFTISRYSIFHSLPKALFQESRWPI